METGAGATLDVVARELGMTRRLRRATDGRNVGDRLITAQSERASRAVSPRPRPRADRLRRVPQPAASARAAGRLLASGSPPSSSGPDRGDAPRAACSAARGQGQAGIGRSSHGGPPPGSARSGHETTLAQIAAEEMGCPRSRQGGARTTPCDAVQLLGHGRQPGGDVGQRAVPCRPARSRRSPCHRRGAARISSEDLRRRRRDHATRCPHKTLPLAQIAMQATMAPNSLPAGTTRSWRLTRPRGEG